MRKRIVVICGTICLMMMLLVSNVFASYAAKFTKTLPWFYGDGTLVDYKTKDSGTDGSTIQILPLSATGSSGYSTVTVWTDVKWQNGGAVSQFSPRKTISNQLPKSEVWLGGYTQFDASSGDKIRLRGCAGGWAGDTISGFWTYY